MSDVKIYLPAKTAMQSGRARTNDWVLEFSTSAAQRRDSLMGWPGHGDTKDQVKLAFPTREEAIGYARRHALSFEVEPARVRRITRKAYADNFSFARQANWTH